MGLANILLIELLIVLALMALLWWRSVVIRNASIVDIFWGIGFVVIGWTSILWVPVISARAALVLALITLWGLRLAAYLAWRNHGRSEDYRYEEMRGQRPRWFWLWSLPCVFLVQGVLMWVVSWPLQVNSLSTVPLNGLDVVGLLLGLVGWLFESLGDWQLARFKSRRENQGRVMQSGLWKYTRHPNYFGDFLVWWGVFLVAFSGSGAWWTILSPLLMSVLLLRVSGVALLEKTIGHRRPDYADYARRTSAFFPWIPRRS